MLRSKEAFLKDPFEDFYDSRFDEYPIDWQISAFDNRRFREVLFSYIVKDVGKVGHVSGSGLDHILWQLPQEYRDELFALCCERRLVCEWYDDFVSTIGPPTPEVVSNEVLPLFDKQYYREVTFRCVAELVRSGKTFDKVGLGDILPQLSQEYRDELFFICCRARFVPEWYDDFVTTVGPVTLSLASRLRLPLFGQCNGPEFNPEEDDIPFGEESPSLGDGYEQEDDDCPYPDDDDCPYLEWLAARQSPTEAHFQG